MVYFVKSELDVWLKQGKMEILNPEKDALEQTYLKNNED